MAAFELNIKATSLTDLEQALKDLQARFPGLEVAGEPAAVSGARRPGRPKSVAAAAHPPAAGGAQTLQGGAEERDLGGAAAGEAGALGSEAAAEAEDQGAAAGPTPEEAQPQDDAQTAGEAGGDAAAGERLVGGEDAGGAADLQPGEGAAEAGAPTLAELKDATKALIAGKGVAVAQQVYGKLGIAKPGQTPEEKIPAAMAAVKRVVEVGLDAWLKEQA